MKYFITLIAMSALFTGCDRMEGQLNVVKAFVLKSSNGDQVKIVEGTHTADIRRSTFGKHLVLRLNDDHDQRYEFRIPKNTNIPSNGDFVFKSNEIGQSVDLYGHVVTNITNSPERREDQLCTYSVPYTVCSPSGPNGQVICQTYMRTVTGHQMVTYYDRNTDQVVNLGINETNSADRSAEFLGHENYTERVIVNSTTCR